MKSHTSVRKGNKWKCSNNSTEWAKNEQNSANSVNYEENMGNPIEKSISFCVKFNRIWSSIANKKTKEVTTWNVKRILRWNALDYFLQITAFLKSHALN